jgi:endonuclease YncB( thermonuclease family)
VLQQAHGCHAIRRQGVISAAIACKLAPTAASGTNLVDRRLPPLAVLVLGLAVAGGASACDGLGDGPAGRVVAVADGNSFTLDSGIVVELVGTRAPLPAGRRSGSVAEPLTDAAKAALSALVLGKSVKLGLDTEETDRYGRMEAEVFLDDAASTWIEPALLGQGMARVEVAGSNRRCLGELLAAEATARANGLGIWQNPYYSVRDASDPATLGDHIGHYEVIEGQVIGTGQVRDRIYLDFGRVWKDDFTATIEGKARSLFAAAGIDPLALTGKRVRIRGWLENRDGPLVELGSPEQIEVLAPK